MDPIDPNKVYQMYLSEQSVVNISNITLTPTDVIVLSRGLTFCPTPNIPLISDILDDVYAFTRKLRLKFHYRNEPQTDLDPIIRKFRLKSSRTPGPGEDLYLDSFIKIVRNSARSLPIWKETTHNITPEENNSLINLTKNPEITIKKADKGSAVVVMDTKRYIAEAMRQLTDENFYVEVDRDLTTEFAEDTVELATKMFNNEEIPESVYKYLIGADFKTPQFYLLPKIHKKSIPGRPILSAIDSATDRLSRLVDAHIRFLIPQIPTYIKDTNDFLRKIDSIRLEPPIGVPIIFTLDVVSLYTNIPNQEGLVATVLALNKKPHPTMRTTTIALMLKTVLHKNCFDFNGRHYLQVGGTAMGSAVAPAYANLFMANLEEKLLHDSPLKPEVFWRYIDDCFGIWRHGEASLLEWKDWLNSQHPSIKFTLEYSYKQINFLDTTAILTTEGRLQSTLYCKPTDTHSYLHFTSCHPHHVCKSLPYSQFLRVIKICSVVEDRDIHLNLMKTHFIKRGYPLPLLEQCKRKALLKTRDELLSPNRPRKDPSSKVALIHKFNPRNPNTKKLIMHYWPILQLSPECKKVFSETPIFGFRRPSNFKDILVRAKISYPRPNKGVQGCQPLNFHLECAKPNCYVCHRIKKRDYAIITPTKQRIRLPRNTDCQTRNAIYLITCLHCAKQYIGETKRTVRIRFSEHEASVRHLKRNPIGLHWNKDDHPKDTIMFLQILETLTSDPELETTKVLRRKRERYWIYKFNSLEPVGLNTLA